MNARRARKFGSVRFGGSSRVVSAVATVPLQALDALETGPPVDLVILDLNMPEMDGIGFLRAMRESPAPTPPVVLLTASCDPDAIAEATRLGARRYFLKADFKLKDLREYVAQQVDLH